MDMQRVTHLDNLVISQRVHVNYKLHLKKTITLLVVVINRLLNHRDLLITVQELLLKLTSTPNNQDQVILLIFINLIIESNGKRLQS